MASSQEVSRELAITKELNMSPTPWVIKDEKGRVAAFRNEADARKFLHYGANGESVEQEETESKVTDLEAIIDGAIPIEQWSNDELLHLGIGYGVPGALSEDRIVTEARERLAELKS